MSTKPAPSQSAQKPAQNRRGSITSSLTFQARALHAEQWRIGLLAISLVVVLLMWVVRRAMGGVVATSDVFYPIVTVLGVALLCCAVALIDIRSRARRGLSMPPWRLALGAAADIAGPFIILYVLHAYSPRGAYAALSTPALLIVPIVIMLSVLRLRPMYSFLIGLGSALAHWTLVWLTVRGGGVDANLIPLLASYGVLLLITGVTAAVLSRCVRQYIQDAVNEAEAAERAAGQLLEIEKELNIARDIQQSLLPSEPPALVGFDVAGMARPATQAGGDYFDWQSLPDGRLVVAIADVTGHGIGPALVMAVCRAYARATVPTAISAADFLCRMNNLIVKDVGNGRFITMAVALVGTDGGVELLSAGHGPTYHYRAKEGRVEQFEGNGMPLGIMDGENYDPTTYLQLVSGDVLVLLTDGFMERMNPEGNLFGSDRLAQIIMRHAALPAAKLIAAIDAEVSTFARGEPQGDDMTIVVLRRL